MADRLGNPASTAVVFVECQVGIIGEDGIIGPLAAAAQPMRPHLARLATGARAAGVRVVHATMEGLEIPMPVPTNAPLWRMVGPVLGWGPGHPLVAVVPEIGVEPDDLVMARHHGFSPTRGTELLPVLAGLGVRTIVVAGVSTNLGIPTVVADAVNEGFDAVVARDAVAGFPADYSELVVKHSLSGLAALTTVDELLERWRA